jgi:hypothetical protein
MEHNVYWGDIHNHNAIGYAKGSLERSFDIAREHLDFFAHAGHSQWPDMPTMPEDKHLNWVRGFQEVRENWPRIKEMTAEAYQPGRFVAFLGYEWHSSAWGDYHIVYPDDAGELVYLDTLAELQEHARKTGAIVVPHHPAYPRLWRGILWEHVDTSVSPITEVFSEHGGAERDRGLHPYVRHSMSGRSTESTVQWALDQGMRLGLVAGTDDHYGYPGAYGEGITAVLAPELTREAVFGALCSRRCYAATGDRIEVAFTVNGAPMGSELEAVAERRIEVRVRGWDEISMVELLRNGEPVARAFGEQKPSLEPWPGRARCRVRWGWGPWATLEMPRTVDWEMRLALQGAKIRGIMPCWQSGPYEEDRRDKVLQVTEDGCRWQSYTSRKDCFAEDPSKGLCLDIEGPRDAVLRLEVREPARLSIESSLGELAERSLTEFTGRFTSESVLMHRLVLPASYEAEIELEDDRGKTKSADYYYVRVTQANGQMAWSSPIWVEAGR